jgi:hypothetical protein
LPKGYGGYEDTPWYADMISDFAQNLHLDDIFDVKVGHYSV